MGTWRRAAAAQYARIVEGDTLATIVARADSVLGPLKDLFREGSGRLGLRNQEAMSNLLTAIGANFDGAATGRAEQVLTPAYNVSDRLSSRLVQRAIHAAENSIAYILDRFDDDRSNLGGDVQAGIDFTNALITLRRRRFTAGGILNDGLWTRPGDGVQVMAQLVRVNDAFDIVDEYDDEVTNAPSVGDNVRDKMTSLLRLLRGRIQLHEKIRTINPPYLRNMRRPYDNAWRLLMDGERQAAQGIWTFETERGYMAGMLRGFNYMLDHLATPLDAAHYELLHDRAVEHVHERGARFSATATFQLGYRNNDGVQFGLILGAGANATAAGVHEFQISVKATDGWSELTPPAGTTPGRFLCRSRTAAQCRDRATAIIDRYDDEVGIAGDEDAVLTAIARCCQDLDQSHLFVDGNIRTVAFLTMNKLLLQNVLSPVLFLDPNIIDCYSLAELVAQMRLAQTEFAARCR